METLTLNTVNKSLVLEFADDMRAQEPVMIIFTRSNGDVVCEQKAYVTGYNVGENGHEVEFRPVL